MAKRKNIKEGTNDSMLHFVSQQLPSGTIGNHSDFSKYKDLDAIRAMMVKKLQKKDIPYSLGALVKLIKDTSNEYKSTTESVQMDASVKEHFNKKVKQKVFERLAEIETTGSVKFDKSDDTNFDVTNSGQPDLEESTPSKLDLLKKQSKDFPSFVKAVKAEFPTMVMDRTAIKWLKDDWDETNESINEEVRFNIYKIAPDLIPMSARSNNKLYLDMVDALNAVYKKHNVAITISK